MTDKAAREAAFIANLRAYSNARKPYANGVVVYGGNNWNGNGFGYTTRLYAVSPDGHIIGTHDSDHGSYVNDERIWDYGEGSRYSRWIAAVKAWDPAAQTEKG